MVSESVHALLLIVFYLCTAAACVWSWHKAPAYGVVVVAGIVIRLIGGVGLVAISYYHWPILQPLQTGDGFWAIAPDARVYFQLAADAAYLPPGSIIGGSPSPTYVLALSLWFRAVGATVTNGVVFNVACYVVAAVVIVRVASERLRRMGVIALFAFSFSPALVLTSTQVLKDAFFAMLIVICCAAAVVILRCASESLAAGGGRLATAVGTACAAIAVMAGVRAYYALFVWLAVACGFVVALWAAHPTRRLGVAAFAATMLVVLWCAFAVGADAYYPYYRDLIARTTGINLSLTALTGGAGRGASLGAGSLGTALTSVREGFIDSGGGTNIGSRGKRQSARFLDVVDNVSTGIAATFVPISVLRAASLINFNGGRGLLIITDVDTLFVDATMVLIFAALYSAVPLSRNDVPSLVCLVTLFVITTGIVTYVVTNYGTLFRLRTMIAAALWLSPLTVTTGVPMLSLSVGSARKVVPQCR
jgi:hypothetical protein